MFCTPARLNFEKKTTLEEGRKLAREKACIVWECEITQFCESHAEAVSAGSPGDAWV